MRVLLVLGAWLGAALAVRGAAAQSEGNRVDFVRDVRPILSDNCFRCHGPDMQERQANLRLDVEEGARKELGGHAAVVRGKPAQSSLVARITATDETERMPPARSGRQLTAAQIDILKRWIEQGAEYRAWWSFVPPKRPPIPAVRDAAGVKNPIDAFVLARLETEGLRPSREASKTTLIRRVTLDLTGVPPTPAEVDAFLADTLPGAYERLVDRLLESPRYGERMANHWLDAARYADTNGYEVDNERHMSLWRDWVVRAFNANMPFDRFTIEQIAGDLLPNATTEQKIATGFNRNHRLNFEAGTIPEEWRIEYVVDRVDTTATVWLGLTMVCARCHDHKYDPVTQPEFYRLFAFFNNIQEVGNGGEKGNAPPILQVPSAEDLRKIAETGARFAAAESDLKALEPQLAAELARWEETATVTKGAVAWTVLEPAEFRSARGATLEKLDDKSLLSAGQRPETDVYTVVAETPLKNITAVRLELLPDKRLPKSSVGRHENGSLVVSEVRLTCSSPAGKAKPVALKNASSDFDQSGWESPKAIDGNPATGWAVSPQDDKYHYAVFETTFDASAAGDGPARLTFILDQNYGQGALIGRFRLSITEAKPPVRAGSGIPDPIATILAMPAGERSETQRADLLAYYKKTAPPKFWSDAVARVDGLRAEKKKLEDGIPTTMVMQDLDTPRETFLLKRGRYDQPGDKVTPGVPASLLPFPEGAPANRLGLARWIVDPANPLTARVIVNRLWEMSFGAGIVRSLENFGSQGALPSHPELLDWLATEFVRSGWDVKGLQRLMVTSAAYRQSSALTDELRRRDPSNRLLARSARYRLPAETLRDQALAVSGLLVDQIGGRPVFPYQPPGIWEELSYGGNFTAQAYVQDHGEKLYRRSLYIFRKRAVPPPYLTVLDAPTRETCTVDRPRTNTPLQALVLLNDTAYAEAARHLARRVLLEGGESDVQRAGFAYRLVLARPPEPEELAVLLGALERYRAIYRDDPEGAKKLISVGESPRDERFDAAELAAHALLSSLLLNLDKTVTRE